MNRRRGGVEGVDWTTRELTAVVFDQPSRAGRNLPSGCTSVVLALDGISAKLTAVNFFVREEGPCYDR